MTMTSEENQANESGKKKEGLHVFVLRRNSILFFGVLTDCFFFQYRPELHSERTKKRGRECNKQNKTMSLSASAVYDEAPATPEEIYLKSLTKVCFLFSRQGGDALLSFETLQTLIHTTSNPWPHI